MEVLYHAHRFSTVKAINDEELLAESTFLSTDFEAVGRLLIDQKSFLIKDARWDIYRSPGGGLNGGKELPGLKGVEAYFNAGGSLRRVAGDEAGGLPRELLADCVKGSIQAETFIFEKRGFTSARAYEEYWDKIYFNACRYFSNLDRLTCRWFDYIGGYEREGTLFNRNMSSIVWRQDGGSLAAYGCFSDSFHELGVHIGLNSEGIVTECAGNFLRAPDRICFENSAHLLKLVGKNIARLNKREIGELVGGSQGCNHLVDMAYDIGYAVTSVLGGKR